MELIGSGRDADVFALDKDRVLRRSREGWEVSREVSVMGYVASFGFPVPRVYEGRGAEMVMQRLYGPTMAAELLGGRLDPGEGGLMLASLHNALHEIPALESGDPSHRVLHLDLHPENVILTPDGPVVIDWRNYADGPAGFDTAVTSVILAQVALTVPAAGELVPAFLAPFLANVSGAPWSYMDGAIQLRRDNPTMLGDEIRALEAVPLFLAELV
jgi:aminoglycoside phosphotransferase (APT) family kinase protein